MEQKPEPMTDKQWFWYTVRWYIQMTFIVSLLGLEIYVFYKLVNQ